MQNHITAIDTGANRTSTLLPARVSCTHCGVSLHLSVKERKEKRYHCPQCSFDVDISGVRPVATAKRGNVPVTSFHAMSVAKLIIMTVATFGFYQFFWFYRNWRMIESTTESEVSPILRTIFSTIFCFSLFRRLKEMTLSQGVAMVPGPVVLTVFFVAAQLTDFFPQGWGLIGLGALASIVLAQGTINKAYRKAGKTAAIDTKYSGANVAGVVVGTIFFIIFTVSMLGESESEHEVLTRQNDPFAAAIVCPGRENCTSIIG